MRKYPHKYKQQVKEKNKRFECPARRSCMLTDVLTNRSEWKTYNKDWSYAPDSNRADDRLVQWVGLFLLLWSHNHPVHNPQLLIQYGSQSIHPRQYHLDSPVLRYRRDRALYMFPHHSRILQQDKLFVWITVKMRNVQLIQPKPISRWNYNFNEWNKKLH